MVQCHGCFDIVHPGHIRHLRFARAQGDLLVVTITGDSEITKGTGRPLIPQELRAENLAELDCVDYVYIEPRPTAVDLLRELKPDVYVKGREYEFNRDPRFAEEREAVERAGGRVVYSSGDVVFSSTALIAALERSVDPYHHRLSTLLESDQLGASELIETVGRFRGKRVVVIGEPIIDSYIHCDRPEVAGEAPVMTLRPIDRRSYDGGAAIVARHLAALGAQPVLVTALPECDETLALVQRLSAEGVVVRHITSNTLIPEKQRFLVGGQKVMKLDELEKFALDTHQQKGLLGLAVESASGCDAAVIADFGLGLFTPTTLHELCLGLRPKVGTLTGDVSGKRSALRAMRKMDLLCPNEQELRDAYQMYDEGLPAVTWRLLGETGSRSLFVTLASEGVIAFDRLDGASSKAESADGRWTTRLKAEHVPALCPGAIDPLGCGEAMLTTATLTLASGASLLASALLGSIAASVQVSRLGNTVVGATDVRHGIARLHASHLAYAGPDGVAPRVAQNSTGLSPVIVRNNIPA